MTTLGTFALGVLPLAGLEPKSGPVVDTLTPTAFTQATDHPYSFTFTDPEGDALDTHTLNLYTQSGEVLLYSHDGTGTSGTISYVLNSGTTYLLEVVLYDVEGSVGSFSQEVPATFSTDTAADPEPYVGSMYEIGLNGKGYMLADDPESPVRRQVVDLQPPRLSTGNSSVNESVERYSFRGLSEFDGGAGVKYADREDYDESTFWDSIRMNPFDDGVVKIEHSMDQEWATPGGDGGTHSFDTISGWWPKTRAQYLLQEEAGYLKWWENMVNLDETRFAVTGLGTAECIVSDGDYWYVSDGADIFRNNTGSDPGSAWSTINGLQMCWAIDRLAVVYDDGAGNMCVTTLDDSGTEEVSGGRFKYPDTVEIPSLVAGDGYLWWIVNRNSRSEIHFWQVGSEDTYAASALTLPTGDTAVELFFYLGQVFVRATGAASAYDDEQAIYQCVPSEGRLIAQELVRDEMGETTRGFIGYENKVAFGWSGIYGTQPGMGLIDLSTGGWVKLTATIEQGGNIVTGMWLLETTSGIRPGIVTDAGYASTYSPSGTEPEPFYIDTPIYDLGTQLDKVWKNIKIDFEPSVAQTVTISYTADNGSSWTALSPVTIPAGEKTWTIDLDLRSTSMGFRVDGVQTLTALQVKAHPVVPSDILVQLPVLASNKLKGLNGQWVDDGRNAMTIVRELESIVNQRVGFQDVDWPSTGTVQLWDVVSVDTTLTGAFNRPKNRRDDVGVCVVTLRKSN